MSLARPLGLSARDLVPLGVALAVLTVGEISARIHLRDAGDDWLYWSAVAAVKVKEAREFLGDHPEGKFLMVGDSTAARHLVPYRFEKGLGREDVAYNLGFPGNFPLAFDAVMTGFVLPSLPLKDTTLVISFHPKGFESLARVAKSEAGILDSAAGHLGRGEPVVARGLRLAALRPAARIERSRVRTPPPDPFHRGWQAMNKVTRRSDWPADDPAPELQVERLEAFSRLLAFARERGLPAIVLVPPHSKGRADRSDPIVAALQARCDAAGVPLLDYRRDARFEDHFADPVHLRGHTAMEFSRVIGADLAARERATP